MKNKVYTMSVKTKKTLQGLISLWKLVSISKWFVLLFFTQLLMIGATWLWLTFVYRELNVDLLYGLIAGGVAELSGCLLIIGNYHNQMAVKKQLALRDKIMTQAEKGHLIRWRMIFIVQLVILAVVAGFAGDWMIGIFTSYSSLLTEHMILSGMRICVLYLMSIPVFLKAKKIAFRALGPPQLAAPKMIAKILPKTASKLGLKAPSFRTAPRTSIVKKPAADGLSTAAKVGIAIGIGSAITAGSIGVAKSNEIKAGLKKIKSKMAQKKRLRKVRKRR